MSILLIEDDRMIGEAVRAALRDALYSVHWVKDGVAAARALVDGQFECVLLDLGLPGRDGLSLLAALRSRGNDVPVLVLTARDSLHDRVQGLDLGADDYLVKPFQVQELLARMRAVARRGGGTTAPALTNGRVSLDPACKTALVDGLACALSGREYALLRELLARPGAILSRRDLEQRIYGWGEEVGSNMVEFIIHGLRKKLGASAILNVRGLGWTMPRRP